LLLCIDIGNTNTVLATFEGDKLVHSWRTKTDARSTADELGLQLRGLLAGDAVEITGIATCSTVPAALRSMRSMLARYYADVPAVIVEPGVRTGVQLAIDNPKEVGADRVMNTLAAYTLFGGPAIVVDFGTSTNFDVISARGEFLGGFSRPESRSRSTRWRPGPPSYGRSNWSSRPASSARTPWSACSRAWCTASPARSTEWCAASSRNWAR
jgi:type III pantothenate kinase